MGSEARKTPRPIHDVGNLPPGLDIAGWRILKRLDVGGYGAVYLVEGEDGVRGALKIALRRAAGASEDPARTGERAQREALLQQLVIHPNILPVWALGRYPHRVSGYFWFVMPFIDGDTLKVWARRHSPTVREVLRVFERLADALQAAHALGILHRDIKSANIRMRREDGQPVLLDFGAGAYPQAAPLTEERLPPGTITHRSPEALRFERLHREDGQARYEYQPTDDLYALGVTFYEVLTGQLPFPPVASPFPEMHLARQIEFKEPPAPQALNAQVPPALGNVVKRLLAKEPTGRHGSAEALRRDLASLASEDAAWEAPLRVPGSSGGEADAAPSPGDEAPVARLEVHASGDEAPARPPAAHRSRETLRTGAMLGLAVLALVLVSILPWGDSTPPVPPTPPEPEATGQPAAPPPPPSRAEKPVTDAPSLLPAPPKKEDPTVKTPQTARQSPSPSPTPPPRRPAHTPSLVARCSTLAVASTAWFAAGCASVQVRPEPGRCPDDAWAAMREIGLVGDRDDPPEWHSRVSIFADIQTPVDAEGRCHFKAGPVVGRVSSVFRADPNKFPRGTLLFGNMWIDEKRGLAWALYTEALLPDERDRVPVCLWYGDYKGWVLPMPCLHTAQAFSRWPDP